MKRNNLVRRSGSLFLAFIIFSTIVYARPNTDEEVLDRKITLVVEQKEMKAVLNEISRLAQIKFVYSGQKIPARKKVSLQVHDERVGDVLNSLLQPFDVLYFVSGSQIVLMKK
jgi:hypothetical protein